MANCFLPLEHVLSSSDEHKKVKSKEYNSTLMLARKLFTLLFFSKKSSKDASISPLLKKLPKEYDNRLTSASPANSSAEEGVKRIKVIITKKQLQELLSKQIQIEDVLTCGGPTTLLPCITIEKWKPELESIPEGDEL